MMKIKEYISQMFFRKEYNRRIKNNRVGKCFMNYQRAKQVLLLFEIDLTKENKDIFRIITQLEADGKEVKAIGFVQKNQLVVDIYPEIHLVTPKDFTYLQKPHDVLINELQQTQYDLLIDLSIDNIVAMQYISLYANAYTKVGAKKDYLELYDLMIELDKNQLQSNDSTFLYNQIIFYLKSIQTSD